MYCSACSGAFSVVEGLFRVAAMTGPASHFIFVIKIFSFDIAQHLKHLARCLFGRLVILVPLVLRVAIGAGTPSVPRMEFMAINTWVAGLPLNVSMFLKTSSARTGPSRPRRESAIGDDAAPGFCGSDCHRIEIDAASMATILMSRSKRGPP